MRKHYPWVFTRSECKTPSKSAHALANLINCVAPRCTPTLPWLSHTCGTGDLPHHPSCCALCHPLGRARERHSTWQSCKHSSPSLYSPSQSQVSAVAEVHMQFPWALKLSTPFVGAQPQGAGTSWVVRARLATAGCRMGVWILSPGIQGSGEIAVHNLLQFFQG